MGLGLDEVGILEDNLAADFAGQKGAVAVIEDYDSIPVQSTVSSDRKDA